MFSVKSEDQTKHAIKSLATEQQKKPNKNKNYKYINAENHHFTEMALF
jgi:hypothetical protein